MRQSVCDLPKADVIFSETIDIENSTILSGGARGLSPTRWTPCRWEGGEGQKHCGGVRGLVPLPC